jgi:hypothetical protein
MFSDGLKIKCPPIGTIGSAIATPTDLVKVRMQAQGKLFDGEIPRYRSTFSAFGDIVRSQGLRGLYIGVGPTVKRAAILTATQVRKLNNNILQFLYCKYPSDVEFG